jgi:hypothetical protein
MSGHHLPNDTDPESYYRRGYRHGAQAAQDAGGRTTADKLKDCVGVKLTEWRYYDRINDRSVPPPSP